MLPMHDVRPPWLEEFGPEYCVPYEITSDPQLVDVSWHGDLAPSFQLAGFVNDERDVRLWVGHPDPQLRDEEWAGYGLKRFHISTARDGFRYWLWTDDVFEAIALLKSRAREVRS